MKRFEITLLSFWGQAKQSNAGGKLSGARFGGAGATTPGLEGTEGTEVPSLGHH